MNSSIFETLFSNTLSVTVFTTLAVMFMGSVRLNDLRINRGRGAIFFLWFELLAFTSIICCIFAFSLFQSGNLAATEEATVIIRSQGGGAWSRWITYKTVEFFSGVQHWVRICLPWFVLVMVLGLNMYVICRCWIQLQRMAKS